MANNMRGDDSASDAVHPAMEMTAPTTSTSRNGAATVPMPSASGATEVPSAVPSKPCATSWTAMHSSA